MRIRKGFSLIELLIVVSIILVILAIAAPNYFKAMMVSREMSAVATVKTLHSVEDLVSGDLARGEKGGYRFVVQATPNGYQLNADPVAYNNSGSRTFYSDQSGQIHQHFGSESATASDAEIR